MIISDTNKFIFIHIPKTGGMSIRNTLEKYSTVPVWKGKPINNIVQLNSKLTKHAKARVVKEQLGTQKWEAYYSFAFVRNPWSWLVSGYHYAKKDKRDWRNKIANTLSFTDYLIWTLTSPDVRHNVLKLGQIDFIADTRGIPLVTYIGKLETLSKDFSHICAILGVPNVVGHVNKTRHKDYRKYYTEKTKELVSTVFYKDINKFNYTF